MAREQTDRESRQPDLDDRDRSTTSGRSRSQQQSIKRRVIRLVLIPSIVALALWFVASGYLVFQGFYNREVANGVRKVSIPAVPALASLQQERRLSVAYLAKPSTDIQELLDQRRQTDQRLSALRTVADSALANAPESIVTRWQAFAVYLDQLPSIRSTVDSRSAAGRGVYDFYNNVLDAATSLFDTQARVVPDVTATQGGIAGVEAFRASDLMSRAGSTIDGAFGSRTLSQQGFLDFVRMVGAYHSALTNAAPHWRPSVRNRYESLTASNTWKELTAAENALITSGAWLSGVPRGLPVNAAQWSALTRQISDELVGLTTAQAEEVAAEALRTGNNQLLTASLGSLVALAIAVAAIMWAIRQSQVLVDRALSIRLARLGQDAATIVDERLPAIMERLRRRDKVDLGVELRATDYGSDEIGQVAAVINRSLQAAAGAAVDEAKARAAGMIMLMGVARRPQRPLQRGLKVIEDLQNRTGDEDRLAELFDVHHQLAQTRRFLENLVILAGGQIGRRFANPVPIRRALLAAFAEAQHYQRITLRRAPDVALLGPSVAGTIHVLAELLDNALAFSPPTTTVWVTCYEVERGVVVEIEDSGVGMLPEVLERANELLATAPTPDVTALKDGQQVGLHVVAELAKRDGIQVSLRTSAYGGVLTIVLLPKRIFAAGAGVDGSDDRMDMAVRVPATAATVPSSADGAGRSVLRPAAASTAKIATVANGCAPHDPGAGGGRGSAPTGGVISEHQPSNGSAMPRQPESSVAGVTGVGTLSPRTDALPPLPERQPQKHLVPELRDEQLPTADSPATRSPEAARARLAQYQQAWAAGQEASANQSATRDDQGRTE
jgi:signal transduction histidine kinase